MRYARHGDFRGGVDRCGRQPPAVPGAAPEGIGGGPAALLAAGGGGVRGRADVAGGINGRHRGLAELVDPDAAIFGHFHPHVLESENLGSALAAAGNHQGVRLHNPAVGQNELRLARPLRTSGALMPDTPDEFHAACFQALRQQLDDLPVHEGQEFPLVVNKPDLAGPGSQTCWRIPRR